jgi:site-specific DNA-methyltransferase (adenine-specific)
LDNCAGSGTTGIACINTNRNCILIEKEKQYFDIINERIAKHTKQRAGEFSFENEL